MTTMVEKIQGTPVRVGRDLARPRTSSQRIGKGDVKISYSRITEIDRET